MDTLGLINIECLSLKIVIKLYPTWWKNSQYFYQVRYRRWISQTRSANFKGL